jgi:hypothetical protein
MRFILSTKKLICRQCKKEFEYATKEYNRQIKKGRKDDEFYCSISCGCTWKNINELRGFSTMSSTELTNLAYKANEIKRLKHGSYLADSPFYCFMRRVKYDKDIDIVFLENLWQKQNGRCAISNIPLILGGIMKPNRASLDRIDSNLGYLRNNVQFVAYSLNLGKQAFTDEQFRQFIAEIKGQAPSTTRGSNKQDLSCVLS